MPMVVAMYTKLNGTNDRFDGTHFLRRLRGKKIMFIGDSISINQWQSLLCMLHAAVPTTSGIITQDLHNHTVSTVTFKHYKVSVMLFRSLYLVDVEEETIGRVLKWDYVQFDGTIRKDIHRTVAFRTALTTWAKWVDLDVDTNRPKVMFQGISPSHYNGIDWNEPEERNCSRQTTPFKGSIYLTGLPLTEYVVKEVIRNIKKLVHLLDITMLSQLRKDARPSTYNDFNGMDCTHWCLAGLPDTWNLLL
ncbi:hypothetical protein GOBAR_AA08702 [Gossypium barbadense]|uniref:Trichome birefringence-like C-terminal domain-containing protein n=1 Tax=Gossypium barbadense TaxID=3634 RepID=A0A2P5Y8T8_GOSBA|nr:hypothetical protein GOBAR_AA08702 [Gossypium barbadense]